tara:strand:+ start:981 stop:1625 length:645 start_codon:yes stop_codon:yes gene_type:complete
MSKFPNEPNSCNFFESDLDEKTSKKFCRSKTIAVDTEAMGLIHGRDRLCLVQICDEDDNVACIRINANQDSAPNLKYLLEEESVDKVFHFARFDVAALSNGLGINVNPIFCTKIASKIARTYSPRHGLKELVLELTGAELDKSAQSSDWGKTEELSIKQLSYASNDVRYLIEIKNKLIIMLKREGRFKLAEKCFKCIPVISELDIRRFTQIFDH